MSTNKYLAATSERQHTKLSPAAQEYWRKRQELIYYQVVRMLVDRLSRDAESMLDVGSNNCPYLDWFPHVPERVSVDLLHPYEAPGVTSIKSDFLAWSPDRKFDVVTCLQVLEHIPEAGAFARKLLEVSKVLVVTVPYKWARGGVKSHVHDPVGEEKMLEWFGRRPNFSYRCREVTANVVRLIHVYDFIPDRWDGLRKREGLLKRQSG